MLNVSYRGNTLVGVPAVHYRAVFAEMVNQACADPATRPEAIAVELEPGAAAAVAGWLRELALNDGRTRLPCMLGLMRPNHWLHPEVRAAALTLQQETGLPLQEIPPDILRRELGYAAVSLLCLSPTDSIIEAIRCAVELNLPLYGIDHDHAAGLGQGERPALRDPSEALVGLAAYVSRHQQQIEALRDDCIDGRRETVMAARLKALLQRHGHVLFTCGMGHWERIIRLLHDPSLAPAEAVPACSDNAYQRVLVHPCEALPQMDLFPAITAAYEAARQTANRKHAARTLVDHAAELRRLVVEASSRCLAAPPTQDAHPRDAGRHDRLVRFVEYLLDLTLLGQQQTPDLARIIRAARSFLPTEWVGFVSEVLMEFDWATTAGYPDLPVVIPEPGGPSRADRSSRRVALKTPRCAVGSPSRGYDTSAPFTMTAVHGDGPEDAPELQWSWPDEPPSPSSARGSYSYQFTWPPCEALFYASLYTAINAVDAQEAETRSEPFTDSLHEGIDLKATLRATLRGEKRLQVRRRMIVRSAPTAADPLPPAYSDQLERQPTVIIFSDPQHVNGAIWDCLRPGDAGLYRDFSPAGRRRYDREFGGRSGGFAESLHYGASLPVPDGMRPWVQGIRLLHGSVRFGNPCNNFYQAARWLEKGRFRVAPFVPGWLSVESVVAMYRDCHDCSIDLKDWRNALIQFALPYCEATRRVIVIAPGDFRPSPAVRTDARRRGVTIATLPLSFFPNERIENMRRQYSVMAGQGAKHFPPELERIFGHGPQHLAHLLPRPIAAQTRPQPGRRKAYPGIDAAEAR